MERNGARITCAIAIGLAAFATPVEAAQKLTGVIQSFECGDNCYLTIRLKNGKENTGLCVADVCEPWLERAEMPRRFIGKRVRVTVSAGQQVDGSGDAMGDFPAFSKIEFLK